MKNLNRVILLVLYISATGIASGQSYFNTLWSESYHVSLTDRADVLHRLSDGSVIIAGSGSSMNENGFNVQLVKISPTGTLLWKKEYIKPGDYEFRSVSETGSGELLLLAATRSENANIWVMKIDARGEEIWDTETGGSDLDQAYSIIESSDGSEGVIVAGAREIKGDRDTDAWIINFDKRGKIYRQALIGERYINQAARSIIAVEDGGYYVGGSTHAKINSPEIPYLIFMDKRLSEVWKKSFPGLENARIESLFIDSDGIINALISVYSTGYEQSGTGLVKISPSGDILEKTINPVPYLCRENSYARTEDGHLIMVRSGPVVASSGAVVARLDMNLEPAWQKKLDRTDLHLASVLKADGSSYLLGGWSGSSGSFKSDLEVLSFDDLSDELVKGFVASRMLEWQAKREDESPEDFMRRTEQKSEEELMADFVREARVHFEMMEPAISIPTVQATQASTTQSSDQINFRSGSPKEKVILHGDYHALLIAVNDYDDPNITDLDQPISDAGKLFDVLISDYLFDEVNVTFLKNPTREEIITALDRLEYTINESDNLLIFYAGHGYWDERTEKGYWLPSDSKQVNTANWIRNSDISGYIKGIKSKHTLLIADACFGGSIFKTRSAFGNQAVAISRLNDFPSRKAMTSGTLKEVPDKSVFVEYLVKRLKENDQQYMPSEQLFYSFKPAVLNNSDNIPQFGEVQNTGDEGGDFIFIRKER